MAPGLGGQPRLADLRAHRRLDRLPDRVRARSRRRSRSRSSSPAVGIILRGGAYALRAGTADAARAAASTRVFAISSILTPFALGAVVGAIASGRVPRRQRRAATSSRAGSTRPRSRSACSRSQAAAYLAAVFLCGDAARRGDHELAERFRAPRARRRARAPAPSRSPGSSSCTATPSASSRRLTAGAGVAGARRLGRRRASRRSGSSGVGATSPRATRRRSRSPRRSPAGRSRRTRSSCRGLTSARPPPGTTRSSPSRSRPSRRDNAFPVPRAAPPADTGR